MDVTAENGASGSTAAPAGSTLQRRVRDLGPWFHNLRFGDGGTTQTAPDHQLGDFPVNFWQHFQRVIPEDLTGQTVLDIGCNAGFYSFQMKRRGARRVVGIDDSAAYLAQAKFARQQYGLDVDFLQMNVYDLDQLAGETFDWVLFMGVLYHLRHPLYALEKVARRVGHRLLFQTMERGSSEVTQFGADYPFHVRDVFADERFPRLFFVEEAYAHDPTNWWIPNTAATLAMLRSVGMSVLERPCGEVYLCAPAAEHNGLREAGAAR